MFTGVFLFGGFVLFSFYRYWITYNLHLAGGWWTAYYMWFYLFLLALFGADIQHVYQFEICEFDWLKATDKFGIYVLPEDEQKKYFLPNWLRIFSYESFTFLLGTIPFCVHV